MEDNILKSKLSVPRPLDRAIERRRLVRMIEEADQANLILLVAPAGYGKTTLAQQVLARRPNRLKLWYHLDDRDADTTRFLKYLLSALQPMLPKFDLAAPASDIRRTTEDLCFALEQYRGLPTILVLDNWECVDHIPEIVAIPLALARSGRDRLTIIVASRVAPSFKIRREQAHGNLIRIDTRQLAFSLAECQEAMRVRFGRDVGDEAVERFWKETSGWCVSLGLLPTSVPHSGLVAASRAAISARRTGAFQGYFREEIYDKLPADFAAFLCETSVLEVLTAERCAALMSAPDRAGEFLTQLERSALPHVALEQRGHYRLHALVRQACRSLLERSATPEQIAALYRQAAAHYRNEGLVFEAIELLMELGDYDTALELMDTKWSDLYGRHGWTRVRQWLEALPDEYRERAAYIKTFSNVLNVSGDNKGAIAFLADRLLPERFSNDIESFGSLWANYWWARINTEPELHHDAAVEAHRELIASTTGFSPTMLGIFQNTLGMAAHLELRLREAVRHVRRAAELVEEPYARLRIIAKQNEALYSHLLGESIAALDILKQARDDCRRLNLQSQYPKMHMLEAGIHLAMGRYRETLRDVDQCEASMRQFGGYSLQLSSYVGRYRGLALWYLGDKHEGLRLLSAAQEPAREFGALTGTEVALLCEYYNLVDDRAAKYVDSPEFPSGRQPSECRLIFLALQAVKALRNQDRLKLRRGATEIDDLARRHELPQWTATASFLLAMSLNQSKDRDRQAALLQRALAVLRKIGWLSYPMASDTITAFVVAKSTRLGIKPELIEHVLPAEHQIDLTPAFDAELRDSKLDEEERIRLWEAASRLSVRGLSGHLKRHLADMTKKEQPTLQTYRRLLERSALPPLNIEILGTFSASSMGRVVRFTRSSARLLLQHLLVAYPRGIHEEELIEHLWPECDPAKGRANLRTGVKDLRKALDPYAVPRGPSYVVYEDQHYGLAVPTGSRIDYLSFTALMEECNRKLASTGAPVDDRITGLRAALRAYRGPLLPMLPYESFTVELRERLQSLYLQGSLKLAELLVAGKSLEEAASVIESALAYDPLWTDGVRLQLQLYVTRGEVLKAMRAFRRYEEQLRRELDLPPDESIRRYFDEILKSSNLG